METETNIPEDASATAFNLHEATRNTCTENGKKTETQTEVQNQETIVIKHLNLEGETIEVNKGINIEECENVPVSHTEEELEIKEGGKCTEEETKDVGEAIEDEALSTLPTSANVKGEKVEKIFQEQTLKEEELAVTDNDNCNQPEHELEQTTNVVESIDQPESETMANSSAQNEQTANLQKEESTTVIVTQNIIPEGKETTESMTNPSYDVDELEKIPESQPVNNSESKDGSKITTDEAIDTKEATDVEIQKSKIESVPKDITLSTLHTTASVEVERVETSIQEEIHTKEEIPKDETQSEFTSEIVQGVTVKEILQQQTFQEEESAAIDNDRSIRAENELEKMVNVFKAIDQPETMAQVGAENEEQADHQSGASSMESVIAKHINVEGKVTLSSSSKSSNDANKLEIIPESNTVANSEIKDGSIVTPEEATDIKESTDVELRKSETGSVPEDKALPNLPNTASVTVETVEESIPEESYMEGESAVTDAREGQIPENNFEEKNQAPKEFGLNDMTRHTSMENGQKDEPQYEVQNLQTTTTQHPNLVEETADINPTNDTEEHEKIVVSRTGELLQIEDDGKFTQDETKEIEGATDMQILKTATESVPENEAQSELPMLAIVEGDTEENLQHQTLQEEELAVRDTNKSSSPENELEETANVVEENDQTENIMKASAENEEHDHLSEASSMESVITKQTNAEGKKTLETSTKSSYDMDEKEKIPELPSVKNSVLKDGSKNMPEEAADLEKVDDRELKDFETESAPEDKAQPTLPNTASVDVEAVDTSIKQEMHKEAELQVMDIKEELIPENDFEEKKEVPKAIGFHQVTYQTSAENELTSKPQSGAQYQETTFIKHLNVEGKTPDIINPINDAEEQEKAPVSHTGEILEITDDGKFKQEEAKEMEKATEMQLLKIASESAPLATDNVLHPSPGTASVNAEEIEQIIQEEIHMEDKLEVANTKEGQIPEIEFWEKKHIPEAFGLHEVTHKSNAENELKAEYQSEAQNQKTTLIKCPNLEGNTTEKINRTKDTEEQDKVPVSHSGEELKKADDGQLTQEEAKEMEKTNEMPLLKVASEGATADKSLQTIPGTASVSVEALEQSIQEERNTEDELPVQNTKEGQIPDIDFEEQMNVPEASGIHEVTHQTSAENELTTEPQSEAQNQETTFIKHPNFEGKTRDIINPINDTEEQEKVQVSHTGEKLEIKEDSKLKQEEANEMEEATEMPLLKIAAERVPADNVLQTLSNTASTNVEGVEQSIKEMHMHDELADTNTTEEQIPETDFGEEKKAFDLQEVKHQVSAENELKTEQTEALNNGTTFIKHPNLEGKTTDTINPINDAGEQGQVPASHTGEKLEIEDDGKVKQEEAKETEEATEVQFLKIASESLPADSTPQTLPSTATTDVEPFEQSIQEEIHVEDELAITDRREGQLPEIDIGEKKNVPETFDLHKVTHQASEENELKAEPQFEAQNQETTFTEHPNLEGKTADVINPINDTEEKDKVNPPDTGKKQEIDDRGKVKKEEAKEMEEATEMQFLKIASESMPEDNTLQNLPGTASTNLEAVEQSIQDVIDAEDEIAFANQKEGQTPEVDFGEKKSVPEAFGLQEATEQIKAENDLEAEAQYEARNQETSFTEHPTLEGNTTDMTNPINDAEEQEKVPPQDTKEKLYDDGKVKLEEAKATEKATEMQHLKIASESVPADNALQTLPGTTSTNVEAVEQSNHEVTHTEDKIEVANQKVGQIPEVDVEEKKTVHQAFGLQEVTQHKNAENELEAEPQSEAQNQETTFTEHQNLEGNTTDMTNPINDTEEQDKVPSSDNGEKLYDDGKVEHEEANETEEATEMQYLKITSESVPADNALQTLPGTTSTNVEAVEQSIQEVTHTEDEIEVANQKVGQIPEVDVEEKKTVHEALGLQEVTQQINAENALEAEPQSEAQNQQTTFTEHQNLEGNTTDMTNPINDTEEQDKFRSSDNGEKLFDDGKVEQEEANETEEATEMQYRKITSESVPAANALQTLPGTTSTNVEAVEQSIQEVTHTEDEIKVANQKVGQIPEVDVEEKKTVHEAFGLQEVTQQINAENKLEAEPQSEAQNQQTTFTQCQNLEGNTTDMTNPINDTEEQDKVPSSDNGEKLYDDGKVEQEEANETEKATEMQYRKITSESVPADNALQTLPGTTSTNVEAVEQSIQEVMHTENEIEVSNQKVGQIPEVDVEEKKIAHEAFGLQEVTQHINAENELEAELESEAQNQDTTFTEHPTLEGKTTDMTNPINDTEEQDKVPSSDTGEKPYDDKKVEQEEAKETEEATEMQILKIASESVPADDALQTLPSTVSINVEVVEQSIQEVMHKEDVKAVANPKEGQIPDVDVGEKKIIHEAFGLQEVTDQISAENELEAEPESEAQNQETTSTEHPNLEGKTTDMSNSINDTEEQDKVPSSDSGEKLHDDGKVEHEEATQTEAATEMQYLNITSESVPADDALQTLPGTAATNVEAVEQINDMVNPINDTEEQDKVPVSHTGEKLEIEDDGKFKQEEAIEMEEATEMQSLKIASESVPEYKVLQTSPRAAYVGVEAVEKSIQEETCMEGEQSVTNTKERRIAEIDFEEEKKLSEAFDLHEVTHQTNVENELKAEPQSEAQNQETTFIKHLNLEGGSTGVITNDNEVQEKVQVSHTGEKSDIDDDGKFIQEEAKEIEEATEMQLSKTASESVPKDKALQSLRNTASVSVEAVEESIPEEIHVEVESEVTNTKAGQKAENDFEEKNKAFEYLLLQAFGQDEVAHQTSTENELKAEPQSEAQNQEIKFIKHPNLEGNTTNIINPSNETEEQEKVPISHTEEKSEIENDGKFKQEKAIEMEEATDKQLLKTASECVPEDKDLQTLLSTASVSVEAVEESIQEETHAGGELPVTNTKERQITEIDFEEENKVPEALGLQTNVENELNAEHHSESQNQAKTFIRHPNMEGETTEINPTNDTEEQEKVPASQSREKSEIRDDRKFIQEEAKEMEEATEMHLLKTAIEGVPDDEAQSKMPIAAFVNSETVEILQQLTLEEDETAAIDNKKTCRQENELEETADIVEAFGLHEATHQTNAENELKAEPQSEAQNQETTFIKHPNLEGTTTDIINPTNDTEDQEKVQVVHAGEKLEIVDDRKFIPSEVKVIEEETEIKLLKTATESVPEDEARSTMPTLAIVKGENEEILKQQTLQGDESAEINKDKSCRQENEIDETTDVVEYVLKQATDHHKTMAKVSAENEDQSDQQSEASSMQSMITEDINAEGKLASESSVISYDVDKVEKIPESHSVENSEINDSSETRSKEAIHLKELTDVEKQKYETESVPEHKVLQTLPSTASGSVENIQEETHVEAELAVTKTKEGQIPEIDFEEKNKVPEAFDLHEVTCQTNTENKQKVEPQSEVQKHETTVIKHMNLEGETIEISPTIETEEHKKIPVSPTRQKLEIEDDGKIIPEEAKEMEEATEMQLVENPTESVPEDENQSKSPTSMIVKDEKVEEFFEEPTQEESAAIHTKTSCRLENELEQMANVVEGTNQPETMAKVNAEDEEHADCQSEQFSMENVIPKHVNSEGMVTKEISIRSSYDVEELEKGPESFSVNNSEIKDGRKIILEDAIDNKEATDVELQKPEIESVPEDKAISHMPTRLSVGFEAAEESIQEEIQKEPASAVIVTKEGQRLNNDFVESTKVLKAMDLHRVTSNTCSENEKEAEPQSNAQRMDTTVIKYSAKERLETAEISPGIDTAELEMVLVSLPKEKLEIRDGSKIKQEEAEETEEATEMQSLKTATESVPEDKAFSTLSTIASIRDETFEKSIQEEIHTEADSAVTDTKEGQRQQKEFEENTKVLEEFDLHKATGYTCMENKKKAEAKSQAQSPETMVIKHLNLEGMQTAEISSINDTEELEKEHKVAKPGVLSELPCSDIMQGYSNEDIPKLKDPSMLSDQNTNSRAFDINKISAHDYCKLDSEKEEKMFIAACGCTPTSTHKNGEAIEGKDNSETTFEDGLTGVAIKRLTTLETEESSHEQEPTADTPAEKIVKASDTNKNLKLAPESMAKEQCDKKNCFDASMYIVDGTSTDDEKGEKDKNSLESMVAETVAAKMDPDGQSDMHESTRTDKSELPVEKIPEPPYPCKKLESYFDSEANNQTKEKSDNILDQISESDDHIQPKKFQWEQQMKPESQMEVEHNSSIPLNAKPISEASLITEVHDGVDRTGGSENIEEQTIDSDKSLLEVQTSFPREVTGNQVKEHDINNFEATDSNDQRMITDLSSENDPIKKEATSRDLDTAIEQADTEKPESQEAEITQVGIAKEDEFEKISPSSSGDTAIIKGSQDTDVKASHKKSHGILSGVGSKVKHSISKVKKAITGKSSHSKTSSPKSI